MADKLIRADLEPVLMEIFKKSFPSVGKLIRQYYEPDGVHGDVEITKCGGCEQELPCIYLVFDDLERIDGWYCYACSRE